MSTSANDPTPAIIEASRHVSAAESAIRILPFTSPAALAAIAKAQEALAEALSRLAR